MLASRCSSVRAFSSRPARRQAGVACRAASCGHSDSPARQQLSRRVQLLLGGAVLAAGAAAGAAQAGVDEHTGDRVVHTDGEWRQLLTPAQYRVLRQEGTELPTTSPLNKEKRRGTFVCAGCGSPLFSSNAKYDSGTGWPSFYEPIDGAVTEKPDYSISFMPRTEVRCKACGGHLGHVFEDGPPPTGLRYCMNGVAMSFEPAADAAAA